MSVIVKVGYLKKLKTNKRKYFVLRAETAETSARLEYYDSEKKFNNGQQPKRVIPLKNCFNINRRLDTKHKHVIALYTKDDCFCVVLDNDEEVDSWLKSLLSLQHGEEAVDGEPPRPTFEHVWQVEVLSRGLGAQGGLIGAYCLCLTDKTLSLIRKDNDVQVQSPTIELNLTNIRSCGKLKNFFFLEIGRSSTLGAGELWMETEDANIAHNVHSIVFHAMSTNSNRGGGGDDFGPKSRNRSSSATESSKPNTMGRKQLMGAPSKGHIFPQDVSQNQSAAQVPNCSTSSLQHPVVSGVASLYQHLIQRGTSKAAERRHSISAGGLSWSGNISHQRTQSLPLANPAPISDQNTTNTSHPPRAAKRSNQSSKCASGGRERCDSMPSRARTTSEGNHAMPSWQIRSHLNPYRPTSFYGRDISHSPPSGSPVSPPSVGCSTDSAGSSYSLADDTDGCTELDQTLGRYSHSLTPDEAIAEEDCPDSPGLLYSASPNNYVPMNLHSSDDGYVDMSPRGRHHNNSPTASLSSVTSGTPSTDMRFSEYPLEKVSSYFTPSEDDDARPTRCYSVGSKPESYRYKKCMEMLGITDNRVRAFSVGSKTSKKMSKVLPHHNHHNHHGIKSSSAPILTNSRIQSSHSSVGPMDDLMEMDFSTKPSAVYTNHHHVNVNNHHSGGYIEMKPQQQQQPPQLLQNNHQQHQQQGAPRTNSHGYVEMKPGIPENSRIPETSPYVDMTSGSSPAKLSFITSHSEHSFNNIKEAAGEDYMEMDPRKCQNNNNNNNNNNSREYLFMSFGCGNGHKRDRTVSTQEAGSPRTPDGYVEMSLGKSGSNNHQRQSSLDGSNEDYTDMTVGKRQRKTSTKKEKRSQPIAIQNAVTKERNMTTSGSPLYSSSLLGRKYSTGTPPKMTLPLTSSNCMNSSSYSSLPRQRSRKNSRRDSKDSSSSSVTTPSSSSAIFEMSLNSPCSPMKPDITPTTSNAPTTIKVPSAVLNAIYKKPSPKKTENDYLPMDFDGGNKHHQTTNNAMSNHSDYVNYNPAEAASASTTTAAPTVCVTLSLAARMSIINMEDARFRPINEDEKSSAADCGGSDSISGDTVLIRNRPSSIDSGGRSRPNSASSELCSSSGSTIVGSRPESVNSDRIRPGSATLAAAAAEAQIHYASLDLDEGTRSPRSKGNNNSSSIEQQQQEQQQSQEPVLTYAAIDFVKSEGLKHNALTATTTAAPPKVANKH